MKHATPLAFSHPRAKRVCFDKDNGKASSFKPDAVPENHFHLGSHNYAVVSDFADVARIHLRRYKLDAAGSLLPTKDGITVTPSVWLALVREFSAIDQAFEDGKVFVIKDCLLLSQTVIENVTHIIMQRYFQRKDFTRKFLTPVSMLKETEWNVLKYIHKQITSKTVSIMFGRVFLKLLRQEVAKHIPFPKSDYVDCIDAEMVLTTSMVELLCNHIEENISSLFVCFGCLEGYENQLGHECMTYSNGQRISEYGDLAILNMDWDKLVADFVNRNIQMTDFPINDKVLASADFGDLSSELDEPFDGVLRGTFSCDKCDSVFTHRRSLERHRLSIHTTSALFHCKICKKRFNRKDNFVRHSKIHKLTPIIMKLSRTANGEENSSANTSSEAAPGPSTATETTLSDHGRTSISTAPSRKQTLSPTRNACLDTFEVYTFFPDTSTSKDLTVSLHSIKTEILKKIKETASSKQGVKWYLNSCVHFIRKITTEDFETCTSYFRSRCAITLTEEIPDVETSIAKVITSCNEFENRGSGWEFQDVLKNELKIAIYKPLAAASYIPLPPKLIKKGNIKHQK
ncbi:PC4 domain-containing protein [Trichonephila clavipes]|nr:PC4 domain-containing protein [Trichonephila clavipes]